jgi:hypothetical protein
MAALLVFMLILLTFAAIFIAVTMARNDAIEKDTLWYEIGKLVAQAGILTGFGALVTLLVHEFQQDQEESRQRLAEASQRLANRHEWLRDFAASLTDAYGQLKQARRRLQWDVTTIEKRSLSQRIVTRSSSEGSVSSRRSSSPCWPWPRHTSRKRILRRRSR